MKMFRLTPEDIIQSGDFLKAYSSTKAVPVTVTAGKRVGDILPYMEPDFEGFYRASI